MYSALSLHEDTSAIAHARGSTVLHPTVHLKKVKSTGQKAERVKWTGGMISLGKLAKMLDRASRDCIREVYLHYLKRVITRLNCVKSTSNLKFWEIT